jgi:hypothetical protein
VAAFSSLGEALLTYWLCAVQVDDALPAANAPATYAVLRAWTQPGDPDHIHPGH